MTTLWETQTLENTQSEEARLHNEQIRERYRRLQNAEETQLSETFADAETRRVESFVAPQSAPVVNESPAVPEVEIKPLTEQQRELFTAETFRRVFDANRPTQQPTVQPVVRPVETTPVVPQKAQEAVEESYSLSSAAKALIAAFSAFVVLMLSLIGINTRILNAKGAELYALETQRVELVEKSRALAKEIEEATSEEAIAQWAAENGWVK